LTEAARIKAGFGAGFALLFGIGLSAVQQITKWEESARWVAHTHEAIDQLEDISLQSKEAEDAARRFVATVDPLDLRRCRAALNQAQKRAAELENLFGDSAAQLRRAEYVRGLIDRQAGRILQAAGAGNPAGIATALAELDRAGISSQLGAATLAMEAGDRRLLREQAASQARTARVTRLLFLAASFCALCLIFAAGWRTSSDARKRSAAEQVLAVKEEQYRQVVELAGDLIYRTDGDGRFTFANHATFTALHFNKSEVIGRSYLKLIRKDKRRGAERFYLRQFARHQKNTYYEFPIVDGYGRERWIGQNVQLVLEGGKATGFQAIARDITDRKRTEAELKKSRNFVERIAATTPGILYVYDLVERRNVFSNREVVTVLGYKPEEMRKIEDLMQYLIHPDDLAMVRAHQEALRYSQDGEVRRIEYRARHADGHWVWLSGRETPFERGPDGLVQQFVGISQDITESRAVRDELAWHANYDALTGLANRHHFWTRLQAALRRSSIESGETALCLFDIDRFKDINDRFGHPAGDEVLEAIGNIVRGELRTNDVAGRLRGDEFCFALPHTDENECARVAERIRERLSTMAFGIAQGPPFSVTATFGIAASGPDDDAKNLMEAADRALAGARAAGRNRVIVAT
jgi:diguanylate cyclase (GGDEF)-like protein/PAS domain S-box-containing protein